MKTKLINPRLCPILPCLHSLPVSSQRLKISNTSQDHKPEMSSLTHYNAIDTHQLQLVMVQQEHARKGMKVDLQTYMWLNNKGQVGLTKANRILQTLKVINSKNTR